MKTNCPPLPASISLDTPIRLNIAAKIAFPDGSMTASGLRRKQLAVDS